MGSIELNYPVFCTCIEGGRNMDQIKVGKFISTNRKLKHMTQRELADILSISDKTISKWETGNGLPEVSLMLPLCEALDISVNELLSGEKLSIINYQEKAEDNMLSLLKENEANRKRLFQTIVSIVTTIIASVSLIMMASFLNLNTIIRIFLISIALIIIILSIISIILTDSKTGYYECPSCHHQFMPTIHEYVKGYHTFTKRYLRCPKCKKTNLCRRKLK